MRHRPLLVWTLALAAGIAVGAGERLTWGGIGLAATLGIVLLGLGGRRWILTVAGIALAGFAAGALRLAAFEAVPATDISHWAGRPAPVTLTGTVVSDPEERLGGRTTLRLRAERIAVQGKTAIVTGEVYAAILPSAGPRGTAPDYGDRVALDGRLESPPGATNPGAFSWRDYLARRAIYCQMRVKRPGGVRRLGASLLNPYMRLAWGARRHALTAIKASLPPTGAAILSGILIGRRTDLPPDLMADFVRTGTVHILASAGLHVGIVAFWLMALCERLTLPRKLSAALMIAMLWLYALMAGGRPSVTRAVVMATVYFAAILFEREPDPPTTVACAALIILLLQPTALLEPGFQLSFLTVLTLAVTMPVWDGFWRPRIERRLGSRPTVRKAALWAAEMAGLSLLAQVGSLPIVAAAYNEVCLSGFAANLLVVPLLFLIIPLGFLGALAWGICHAGGAALLLLTNLGLGYITAVVRGCGESPWAACALPTPSPALIAAYYALVYGGTYALSARTRAAAPAPDPDLSPAPAAVLAGDSPRT